MSAVKAEKAMKRITRNSVFRLCSEAEIVMNDSFSRIFGKGNRIKSLVKSYSPRCQAEDSLAYLILLIV